MDQLNDSLTPLLQAHSQDMTNLFLNPQITRHTITDPEPLDHRTYEYLDEYEDEPTIWRGCFY